MFGQHFHHRSSSVRKLQLPNQRIYQILRNFFKDNIATYRYSIAACQRNIIAIYDSNRQQIAEIASEKIVHNTSIIYRLSIICLCTLGLSGCGHSWFADPKTNPVIEDHVNLERGVLATLATTPERRVVLVNTNQGSENFGKFCAEPPADVAESVAASFQAALTAAATNPSGQRAELGGELGRNIASAVQSLGQRSQGLTMYRDGTFHLCALLLNGFITRDQMLAEWADLRERSYSLIMKELELNQGRIGSGELPSISAPDLDALQSLLTEHRRREGQDAGTTQPDGG